MTVTFTVLGDPMGKGRPRFKMQDGKAIAYTPHDTVVYEQVIRSVYKAAYPHVKIENYVPVYVHIDAYFRLPSLSKRKKERMVESGRPTKKPDCDNIVKAICDALNDVAYHDDSQIVSCSVEKAWANEFKGEMPRVVVSISDEGVI